MLESEAKRHLIQMNPHDGYCGPACVAMVSSIFGKPMTLSEALSLVSPERFETSSKGNGQSIFFGEGAFYLQRLGFETVVHSYDHRLVAVDLHGSEKAEIIEWLHHRNTYYPDGYVQSRKALYHFLNIGGEIEHEVFDVDSMAKLIKTGSVLMISVSSRLFYGVSLSQDFSKPDPYASKLFTQHLVLAVGTRDDNFLIMDPTTPVNESLYQGGVYEYNAKKLLAAITGASCLAFIEIKNKAQGV